MQGQYAATDKIQSMLEVGYYQLEARAVAGGCEQVDSDGTDPSWQKHCELTPSKKDSGGSMHPFVCIKMRHDIGECDDHHSEEARRHGTTLL